MPSATRQEALQVLGGSVNGVTGPVGDTVNGVTGDNAPRQQPAWAPMAN